MSVTLRNSSSKIFEKKKKKIENKYIFRHIAHYREQYVNLVKMNFNDTFHIPLPGNNSEEISVR